MVGLGCAIAACSLVVDLSTLGPGDGGSDATPDVIDATPDVIMDAGDAAADANRCPSGKGPSMVEVPYTVGTFCIDSTEVTAGQYAAFIAADAGKAGQPARCVNNTTFVPSSTGQYCTLASYDPINHPSLPARCVDWCDAYAFCKWAGKRLCGLIGVDAGPSDFNMGASTNAQWYWACSHGGSLLVPYGNAYDGGACNGKDFGAGQVRDAGGTPSCVGGFPGLYDMSGNVAEFIDACNDDAGQCASHGGGYNELESQVECPSGSGYKLTDVTDALGFRCCAD